MRDIQRIWVARVMIGIVIFFNIQSAVSILLKPEIYTNRMGLPGVAGSVYLRGIGILFLMWNVPYVVALLNPVRYRVSLLEAVCMQAIGLFGETILFIKLPYGHTAIQMTLTRFILFDGAGLLFLLGALWVTHASGKPDGGRIIQEAVNV